MADEIERILQIIDLSRQALKVIRQNVIFSMSMNVLSVILGGFGIIGPVIGALMHETSALPVLDNSAPDVRMQIAAVRSTLNSVGRVILEDHIQSCMVEAVEKDDYKRALRDLKNSLDKITG